MHTALDCGKAAAQALLREADNAIVWEAAMPNGGDYQRCVEAALGIGQKNASGETA